MPQRDLRYVVIGDNIDVVLSDAPTFPTLAKARRYATELAGHEQKYSVIARTGRKKPGPVERIDPDGTRTKVIRRRERRARAG